MCFFLFGFWLIGLLFVLFNKLFCTRAHKREKNNFSNRFLWFEGESSFFFVSIHSKIFIEKKNESTIDCFLAIYLLFTEELTVISSIIEKCAVKMTIHDQLLCFDNIRRSWFFQMIFCVYLFFREKIITFSEQKRDNNRILQLLIAVIDPVSNVYYDYIFMRMWRPFCRFFFYMIVFCSSLILYFGFGF